VPHHLFLFDGQKATIKNIKHSVPGKTPIIRKIIDSGSSRLPPQHPKTKRIREKWILPKRITPLQVETNKKDTLSSLLTTEDEKLKAELRNAIFDQVEREMELLHMET
jgi:hypothetical protein